MTLRRTQIGALTLCGVLLSGTLADAAPPGPRDPELAVPTNQGAATFARGGLGRSASRSAMAQVDWQHDQPAADTGGRDRPAPRTTLAQAQAGIPGHAAQQAKEQKQQKLLAVLAGLFNVLDAERSAVIAGLDRFGARQQELAAGIRQDNEKLRQMQADSAADTNEVNQLVQRVTWEAEVFQDRRQSLSYACNVPGTIEQRLFALARTIQQNIE